MVGSRRIRRIAYFDKFRISSISGQSGYVNRIASIMFVVSPETFLSFGTDFHLLAHCACLGGYFAIMNPIVNNPVFISLM